MSERAFIRLPMHDRDEALMDVAEIAALREHTVVSYSYEKWTVVTLRNGATFDCRIALADVEQRMRQAVAATPSGGDPS